GNIDEHARQCRQCDVYGAVSQVFAGLRPDNLRIYNVVVAGIETLFQSISKLRRKTAEGYFRYIVDKTSAHFISIIGDMNCEFLILFSGFNLSNTSIITKSICSKQFSLYGVSTAVVDVYSIATNFGGRFAIVLVNRLRD